MEILKVSGDSPQARFGHTVTFVGQKKAVLFGGAIGDTGKYSITADTFVFDCTLTKWKKIEPGGSIPSPRAAHASACVETLQMVVFGGATGGGGLASDDLYLLDLRDGDEKAKWLTVPVVGGTPGKRYGHTMAFAKPFLVVFAGNTGNEPVNDVWVLNVEKPPYCWSKLTISGEAPPVRVYHYSSMCFTGSASGMMVTFGGRTADSSALNDTWGLRRHRDGRWDWVKAPYKSSDLPLARYQHSTMFINSLMLVLGGRTNTMSDVVPIEVYNTETSEWTKFPSLQRFRHASWLIDSTLIYVHGGFEPESPNTPIDVVKRLDVAKLLQANAKLLKVVLPSTTMAVETTGQMVGSQQPALPGGQQGQIAQMGNNVTMGKQQNSSKMDIENSVGNTSNVSGKNSLKMRATPNQKGIRLANQAIVATSYGPDEDANRLVKRVAIHKLQEESKKLGIGFQNAHHGGNEDLESTLDTLLPELMKLQDWQPGSHFSIRPEEVAFLCTEVRKLLEAEPVVLKLRSPLKIFGSVYGQWADLMRLFANFGAPNDIVGEGDIDSFDYLFLGNFVDRGGHSLEVVCLLFALKLRHPDQIHLVRGAHEDGKTNRQYGLADECAVKLREDPNDPSSIFNLINKTFEFLPLAATIENKALCVPSGVGSTLFSIEELESIRKPIQVIHPDMPMAGGGNIRLQKIVYDLLWSIPEALPSADETVSKFLGFNNMSMIIRGKDCVPEGIEESCKGAVVTLISASNYGGKYGNNAAILIFKKNGDLTSKTIPPLSTPIEDLWLDDKKTPRPATPPRKRPISTAM